MENSSKCSRGTDCILCSTQGADTKPNQLTYEDLVRLKERFNDLDVQARLRREHNLTMAIAFYEAWIRVHPNADIETVREIRRRWRIAKLELLELNDRQNDNSNRKAGQ